VINPLVHRSLRYQSIVCSAFQGDCRARHGLRNHWQEQFARDTKETRYEPFLPASARPPLTLNQATMDKYRAEMKKHYLNRRPEFQ
jgi:hypothetical protein